jgi:hypothetical protein
MMYLNVSDSDYEVGPFPSPPSFLTHERRCIGPHNGTRPMDQPVRLMYLSVSDSDYEVGPSPSPRSSLTHPRRFIGPHNGTSSMTQPVRLMYPSVLMSCMNPHPLRPHVSRSHMDTGVSVHTTEPVLWIHQ